MFRFFYPGSFVPGTFLVAFLIFSGRWGSHIGVSPFYLTEIFAALTVITFISLTINRKKDLKSELTHLRRNPFFWGSIVITMYAFLILMTRYPISILSLRDFAPYGYAMLTPVSIIGFGLSTLKARENTLKVMWIALLLHMVWVFISLFTTNFIPFIPVGSSGISIFTIRPDFDSAMIGVLLTFAFWKTILNKGNRYANLIVIFFCSYVLFPLDTRAGIMSAILIFLSVTVLITYIKGFKEVFSKAPIYFSAIMIVTGSLFGGGLSNFWERVTSTSQPIITVSELSNTNNEIDTPANKDEIHSSKSETALSAQGTANARLASWGTLTDWINDSNERAFFGVGFGTNFLFDSGAAEDLIGKSNPEINEVRSPHNYWLGTWARTGILGIMLIAVMIVIWFFTSVKLIHRTYLSEDSLFYFVLPLSLIIPATFGVILESPFGYVVWWWALGAPLGILTNRELNLYDRS